MQIEQDIYYPIGLIVNLATFDGSEVSINVTRFGDFLHFGQPFKAGGSNFLPKMPTLLSNFCKGVKINHFSREIILGNFYRHLGIFIWSHWHSHIKISEQLLNSKLLHCDDLQLQSKCFFKGASGNNSALKFLLLQIGSRSKPG